MSPLAEIDLSYKLDAILDKGRDISLLIDSLKHSDRNNLTMLTAKLSVKHF